MKVSTCLSLSALASLAVGVPMHIASIATPASTDSAVSVTRSTENDINDLAQPDAAMPISPTPEKRVFDKLVKAVVETENPAKGAANSIFAQKYNLLDSLLSRAMPPAGHDAQDHLRTLVHNHAISTMEPLSHQWLRIIDAGDIHLLMEELKRLPPEEARYDSHDWSVPFLMYSIREARQKEMYEHQLVLFNKVFHARVGPERREAQGFGP